MKSLLLERQVTIEGRTAPWGSKAHVSLTPTHEPGWFWNVHGEDIPLTPELLRWRWRQIQLNHKRARLPVFEHLSALRLLMGLDGVRVCPGKTGLPFDGSAKTFYLKTRDAVRKKGLSNLEPWTVSVPIRQENDARGSFVEFIPGRDVFRIEVHIHYNRWDKKRLGPHDESFVFPGTHIEEIAFARTPGWPTWPEPLLRTLSRGSKRARNYYESIAWPNLMSEEEACKEIVRHRVLDIMGAFSFLCVKGGTLTGTIRSHCAGHGVDVHLIRRAAHLMKRAADVRVKSVAE